MSQKSNKYDEIILDAVNQINEKFGSQAEFAKVLGVSEQNLSNKLRRMTEKFIVQLKQHGVIVNKSLIGDNSNYNQVNSELVKVLKQLSKSQDETIRSQRLMLEAQQTSLSEKNKIIADLTKELAEYRKMEQEE